MDIIFFMLNTSKEVPCIFLDWPVIAYMFVLPTMPYIWCLLLRTRLHRLRRDWRWQTYQRRHTVSSHAEQQHSVITNINILYRIVISLSTIVLNSRDWSEIIWLPKISRFKINLAIGFIR